jgi:hypothetical protein
MQVQDVRSLFGPPLALPCRAGSPRRDPDRGGTKKRRGGSGMQAQPGRHFLVALWRHGAQDALNNPPWKPTTS